MALILASTSLLKMALSFGPADAAHDESASDAIWAGCLNSLYNTDSGSWTALGEANNVPLDFQTILSEMNPRLDPETILSEVVIPHCRRIPGNASPLKYSSLIPIEEINTGLFKDVFGYNIRVPPLRDHKAIGFQKRTIMWPRFVESAIRCPGSRESMISIKSLAALLYSNDIFDIRCCCCRMNLSYTAVLEYAAALVIKDAEYKALSSTELFIVSMVIYYCSFHNHSTLFLATFALDLNVLRAFLEKYMGNLKAIINTGPVGKYGGHQIRDLTKEYLETLWNHGFSQASASVKVPCSGTHDAKERSIPEMGCPFERLYILTRTYIDVAKDIELKGVPISVCLSNYGKFRLTPTEYRYCLIYVLRQPIGAGLVEYLYGILGDFCGNAGLAFNVMGKTEVQLIMCRAMVSRARYMSVSDMVRCIMQFKHIKSKRAIFYLDLPAYLNWYSTGDHSDNRLQRNEGIKLIRDLIDYFDKLEC